MFPSAGAELRIAIAGPAVSLLLGGLFVAVAVVGGLGSAGDGVAAWLGYINLLLLAFNLGDTPQRVPLALPAGIRTISEPAFVGGEPRDGELLLPPRAVWIGQA